MLPSSTVENYLKAIYLGSTGAHGIGTAAAADGPARRRGRRRRRARRRRWSRRWRSRGSSNTSRTPGVALTRAGRQARRTRPAPPSPGGAVPRAGHGLRWDEVHDEAEQLEHVVSDRLIDRMDEMLGRPEADPHGDPIPDAEGVVKKQQAQTLLTCPFNTRVTVTRIIDQDKQFLRFIESNDLKPGESIEVEQRDEASDSVRLRGKDDRRITIGARAASKLLVQVARAILLLLVVSSAARAQAARPFEITDNSFFVEEAFNQEAGIVQNIATFRMNARDEWDTSFTQEWPLFSHMHQISYTIPYAAAIGGAGVGDAMIHYRIQLLTEGDGTPAFSPRISLIVPSGNADRGLGGERGLAGQSPVQRTGGRYLFALECGVDSRAAWPFRPARRGKRDLARAADAEPDARNVASSGRNGCVTRLARERSRGSGWNRRGHADGCRSWRCRSFRAERVRDRFQDSAISPTSSVQDR